MVSWKRVLWLMVPLLLMPAVAWGFQEGGSTLIQTGGIEEPFLLRLGRGALAMAVILVVLWRFSPRRKSIDWTLVAKGVGLQLVDGLLSELGGLHSCSSRVTKRVLMGSLWPAMRNASRAISSVTPSIS